MTRSITVLYEDNHCLAVDKPAGILTMGDHTGERSLVDFAAEYLKQKYSKPGNVFVGVVHRIDRPVSGVVLFARTSKGASRLSEQFRTHTTEKIYLALVEGFVQEPQGELHDFLVKDHDRNFVSVTQNKTIGQECFLSYSRLERFGQYTLLEIRPTTGRSHQIRVQLSSRGWPIAGDHKYGSKTILKGFIALHAASLKFVHPTSKESLTVHSPLPDQWINLQRPATNC